MTGVSEVPRRYLRVVQTLEALGFSLLIAAFLATVVRLDGDQLVPAACLAGGLTSAVLTVSRGNAKLPVVMLGGLTGTLGLFLTLQAVSLVIAFRLSPVALAQPFRLPRVLPGSLIFGLEGLLIGLTVGTLLETAKHLRLSFSVVIFVVWGTFFVAYAYWLS